MTKPLPDRLREAALNWSASAARYAAHERVELLTEAATEIERLWRLVEELQNPLEPPPDRR